jgi:large subunit ribosomal protein L31
MKATIHPQYHTNTVVTCACGNTFVTGSTSTEIYTEICSACHPFYTGKQKLIDTAGHVDKFRQRMAKAARAQATKAVKKPRKARGTAAN